MGFIVELIYWLFIAGILSGVLGVFVVIICFFQAKSLEKKYPITTLYELICSAKDYVHYDDISPHMLYYAVGLEDQRFFSHPGVDIIAIKEAIRYNLINKTLAYGASTITQQLAKNLYFTFDKSIFRKFKEAFLALRIEKALTKSQILEFYLNIIEYGNNQWGISNAANFYFNKASKNLTDNQALILLISLPAPDALNPLKNPEGFVSVRSKRFDALIRSDLMFPERAYEIETLYPVEFLDEELQQREPLKNNKTVNVNPIGRTLLDVLDKSGKEDQYKK